LIFPPPLPFAPTPQPFDVTTLNAEQAALWQAAQRDSLEKPAGVSAIESWGKFIQSNPPESFAAFGPLFMALPPGSNKGKPFPALDQLDQVIKKFSRRQKRKAACHCCHGSAKQLELAPSQTNFSPQSVEPQLSGLRLEPGLSSDTADAIVARSNPRAGSQTPASVATANAGVMNGGSMNRHAACYDAVRGEFKERLAWRCPRKLRPPPPHGPK